MVAFFRLALLAAVLAAAFCVEAAKFIPDGTSRIGTSSAGTTSQTEAGQQQPSTSTKSSTSSTKSPGASAQRITATGYTAAAEADRVRSLPGIGAITGFDMFSGYITVDAESSRKLFYSFVTSKGNPASDPLMLWLNGGPGCSSLGGGFFSELGPWFPGKDARALVPNPHAWNSFANMLFLEAPAFVGFSYSRDMGDACVDDKRTARDNLLFLLGFFDRFPSFQPNDFWIAGESYAGHYVPQLAWEVIDHNDCIKQGGGFGKGCAHKAAQDSDAPASPSAAAGGDGGGGDASAPINLEGISLGNAWTEPMNDNRGTVEYWWTHVLISDRTYKGMKQYCDFAKSNPLDPHPEHDNPQTDPQMCDNMCHEADEEIGDIDIYDVITDDCKPPRASGEVTTLGQRLLAAASIGGEGGAENGGGGLREKCRARLGAAGVGGANVSRTAGLGLRVAAKRDARLKASRAKLTATASGDVDPPYDPCTEDYAIEYLNRPDVQAAMHANQSSDVVPWTWKFCQDFSLLHYCESDLQISMVPLYDKLLDRRDKLKILLYSGDADGSVPCLGTRYWLSDLYLRQSTPDGWRTWRSNTGQVGGYVAVYKELVFATIRAAGHMAPYSQPERTHFLVSHFVAGKDLPR